MLKKRIKDRVIRIIVISESEKEDCYKLVRTGNAFSDNCID